MSCLLWITAKPVKTEVTGEPTCSCRELQTSDTALGESYENAQVLKESYPQGWHRIKIRAGKYEDLPESVVTWMWPVPFVLMCEQLSPHW